MFNKFLKFCAITAVVTSCGNSNHRDSFISKAQTTPSDLIDLMDKGESTEFNKQFLSRMPKATENGIWLRNGYVPSENLKLNVKPKSYESVGVGESPKTGLNLTSTPVIANGVIFTLAGQGEVQARDINNPKSIIWEKIVDQDNVSKKKHGFYRSITGIFYESEMFLGGNIAYSSDTIFVTTKRGNIYALDAKNGETIWTKKIDHPIRSAPAASAGKLIFTTSSNKTYALNTANGKTIWVHEGLAEKSKLSTSPAPLIQKGKAIITYSSGEVYQLDLDNGIEIWSALTSPSLIQVLNPSINDIGFSPTFHKGRIFVVTSDGRLVGLDYASGNTLFELEGHSISRPIWAVSDSIFAVTRFGKLISVSISSGKVAWQADLASPEDIIDDKILFTGAIMAEGVLYVASNKGYLKVFSPENGKLLKEIDISSNVILSPVVAEGKMFLITSKSPKLVYFE